LVGILWSRGRDGQEKFFIGFKGYLLAKKKRILKNNKELAMRVYKAFYVPHRS